MKIGCVSSSFQAAFASRELDLLGFAQLAAELALDGIEPTAGTFPSVSERYLHELRESLTRFGVEISAISVANDFAFPDADERKQQTDDVIAWTHVCRDLGVRCLHVRTGELHEGIGPKRQEGWVYRCCERVVEAAERAGVTVALDSPGALMSGADDLAGLVFHFGSPHLQLNADATQFIGGHPEGGEAPGEVSYRSLAAVARLAVHSTLKLRHIDGSGRPTDLDLRRMLETYRRVCYDGYISLSYTGEGDARDTVTKAAEHLRTLIDEP